MQQTYPGPGANARRSEEASDRRDYGRLLAAAAAAAVHAEMAERVVVAVAAAAVARGSIAIGTEAERSRPARNRWKPQSRYAENGTHAEGDDGRHWKRISRSRPCSKRKGLERT